MRTARNSDLEGENTTNAHVPVWPLYLCFGQASNHSVPARPVSAIGVPQLTALARTLKRKTWGALYPPGDSSWGGGRDFPCPAVPCVRLSSMESGGRRAGEN